MMQTKKRNHKVKLHSAFSSLFLLALFQFLGFRCFFLVAVIQVIDDIDDQSWNRQHLQSRHDVKVERLFLQVHQLCVEGQHCILCVERKAQFCDMM